MPYLDKYTGLWSHSEANHLLKRTTFGPSPSMIDEAFAEGMENTVIRLLSEIPMPAPPLKSIPDGTGGNALDDPWVAFGETWVDAPPFPNVQPPMYRNRILRSRSKSLYSWTILQMFNSGTSIREKMALFWHNHFVTANSVIPHREYVYYSLLRSMAVGNFKELTKEITIDTNMLIYLSGAENTNTAPNENYARELLELFTLGKGPQVAPGDYTTFTEDDVVAMAKILTGWRVPNLSNTNPLEATFAANRHTPGSKQLSNRFGNKSIAENGDQEYRDLIDVIFEHEECPKFITRKIYRWFIGNKIDDTIEQEIIEPLAEILRINDFEVAPMLETLLMSEHFYETTACLIKSPIDLVLSASRSLGIEPPQVDLEVEYDFAYNFYIMASDMEQAMYYHPDVAGWKAYYQEPSYDKLWINNLLLPKRQEFCRLQVDGGMFSYNDVNYSVEDLVPVLDIAASINNAIDPNTLINELANRLFNFPIQQNQVDSLKDILIPGLPDFEWSVEYSNHLSDPSDTALKASVENKLKSLISVMVRMSEFQLM